MMRARMDQKHDLSLKIYIGRVSEGGIYLKMHSTTYFVIRFRFIHTYISRTRYKKSANQNAM